MGESSKSIMAHRVQIFLPTTDGILDHIQIDLQGVGRDIVCVKEFLQKNCLHLISCSNKTLITTDCKSATSANFFCQEATCKPLLRKKPWLISWNIIDGKSYILSQLIRLFSDFVLYNYSTQSVTYTRRVNISKVILETKNKLGLSWAKLGSTNLHWISRKLVLLYLLSS